MALTAGIGIKAEIFGLAHLITSYLQIGADTRGDDKSAIVVHFFSTEKIPPARKAQVIEEIFKSAKEIQNILLGKNPRFSGITADFGPYMKIKIFDLAAHITTLFFWPLDSGEDWMKNFVAEFFSTDKMAPERKIEILQEIYMSAGEIQDILLNNYKGPFPPAIKYAKSIKFFS